MIEAYENRHHPGLCRTASAMASPSSAATSPPWTRPSAATSQNLAHLQQSAGVTLPPIAYSGAAEAIRHHPRRAARAAGEPGAKPGPHRRRSNRPCRRGCPPLRRRRTRRYGPRSRQHAAAALCQPRTAATRAVPTAAAGHTPGTAAACRASRGPGSAARTRYRTPATARAAACYAKRLPPCGLRHPPIPSSASLPRLRCLRPLPYPDCRQRPAATAACYAERCPRAGCSTSNSAERQPTPVPPPSPAPASRPRATPVAPEPRIADVVAEAPPAAAARPPGRPASPNPAPPSAPTAPPRAQQCRPLVLW